MKTNILYTPPCVEDTALKVSGVILQSNIEDRDMIDGEWE